MAEARIRIGAVDDASRVLAKVQSNLVDLQTTGAKVKAVLGSLGVTLSAGLIASFVRGVVDGVDALNDLKDATGSSIENLSALEDVASRTGTSFDTVGSALVKFNGVLKDARPGSDAAAAFQFLSLSVAQLKALDPAEALRLTAVRLATFADDGKKARLSQELFGKSLREVAPFLKNLAESGELVAKVTTAQAEAAERFNKQLASLRKNSEDAARSLVGDLLPGLNRMLETFTRLKEEGVLFSFLKDTAKDVFSQGRLSADAGADVNRLLKERDAIQKKLADRRFPKVEAEYTERLNKELFETNELLRIAQIRMEGKANASISEYSDQVSRRFNRAKPSIAFEGGAGTGGAAKQSEAARYLENLQKQLEKTRDLSVEEQLLTDLQAKRLGIVAPKLREQLVGTAQQIDAALELIQLRKDEAEALVKNSEATRQRLDGLQRENAASVEHNRQLRDSTAELGLTTTALDALRLARLDETIAHEQELLTNQRNANAGQAEIAIIEQRIALKRIERDLTARSQAATRENALIGGTATADLERKRDDMLFLTDLFERGRIGETQYLEAVTLRLGIANEGLEKSKTLAEELGGTFTSAFEDAIVGGKGLSSLLKGLEQDILRIVTHKLVTEPLGGGGGLGSIFEKIGTSIFGGFKAEGGPVSAGVPYIVGEQGPELFMPRSSGTIVPNGGMGGNTVNITINQTFAAGTNRATLMQAAADARRQLEYAGRNL